MPSEVTLEKGQVRKAFLDDVRPLFPKVESKASCQNLELALNPMTCMRHLPPPPPLPSPADGVALFWRTSRFILLDRMHVTLSEFSKKAVLRMDKKLLQSQEAKALMGKEIRALVWRKRLIVLISWAGLW